MSGNIETGTGILADQMMIGAIEYCKSKGVNPLDHSEAIVAGLKEAVSDTMSEALADAKEAYEAGMSGWMSATATASFRLAGINVAKKVLGH